MTTAPLQGAGALAAATTAEAALVVAGAAAAAWDWPEAEDVAQQARTIASGALWLAERNAEGYGEARRALAGQLPDVPQELRDDILAEAVAEAAQAPLSIAELAARTCELAAEVASHTPTLQATDAKGAATVACGAARAAAMLVQVNLTVAPEARAAATAAEDAAVKACERAMAL